MSVAGRRWALLVSVGSSFGLAGCASDEVDIGEVGRLDYGGRVERIETLGRYSELDAMLLLGQVASSFEFTLTNDFYLYRVVYPTRGLNGETTPVSGLVALPAERRAKGIVAWQHGTNTYRPNSISKPSLPEGLGIASLFAADGYVLVAADYIGLGVSTVMQGYYDWPSTLGTVLDLVTIAGIMRDGIFTERDEDLYLAGFSQGGGATAALQRSLEQEAAPGVSLRAAAPIAAAFDPRGTSLDFLMRRNVDVIHLGLLLASIAEARGASLAGVVREPYVDALAGWFDGTHDDEFLASRLPAHVDQLLSDQFVEDYRAGRENPPWLYDALAAARTNDCVPVAPLRIHFGSADSVVTPEEARTTFESMHAAGGHVALVDVGPYDHDESALHSLPPIQRWFDALEGAAP
jgi:hypothetical protein